MAKKLVVHVVAITQDSAGEKIMRVREMKISRIFDLDSVS